MRVSLIGAVAENGVIGRNNDLPWTIKDDMRFFVQKTKGHVVIMGRRNFESFGKPLRDRTNIVVSRKEGLLVSGCLVVSSVERALVLAEDGGEEEAFVMGGAEIYRLALPYAQTFYRTRVLAEVPGDVFFPEFDESAWKKRELFRQEQDDRNEHAFIVEELTARFPPLDYRQRVDSV